jgi:hypothetical protein
MKSIVGILVFIGLLFPLQDKTVIKLDGKPDIFTIDNFDNIYVYQKNTLKKYNIKGELSSCFSSFEYGQLQSMDVSDPLQLVLFYKEFNIILFLDNNLNPLGKAISLDKLGFTTIDAVCKSKEFGVWLLDSYAQKLILYGFNPKGIIREISLLKYTKSLLYLDKILENGDEVYLSSTGRAVWVFNQMGGKLSLLKVYPATGYQVRNDKLIYSDKKFLYQYNSETEQIDTLSVNGFKKFDDIKLGNSKIFILKNDSIIIMSK